MNFNCSLLDCNRIEIGDGVLFGPNVQIYPPGHPIDPLVRNGLRGPEFALPVKIGSNTWIGGGVIILGDGCLPCHAAGLHTSALLVPVISVYSSEAWHSYTCHEPRCNLCKHSHLPGLFLSVSDTPYHGTLPSSTPPHEYVSALMLKA